MWPKIYCRELLMYVIWFIQMLYLKSLQRGERGDTQGGTGNTQHDGSDAHCGALHIDNADRRAVRLDRKSLRFAGGGAQLSSLCAAAEEWIGTSGGNRIDFHLFGMQAKDDLSHQRTGGDSAKFG